MKYKGLCLDISGVLYDGSAVIDGSLDAFARLQASGLPMRLLTNTSRSPKQSILDKLTAMGFAVSDAMLYTAPLAARDYCRAQQLQPWCLVDPAIAGDFAEFSGSQPNAVFIADAGDAFSYANLNKAFQLCVQGFPLIAVGDNKYFSENGALQLDAGAFVKAVEYAAGCKAIFCGKPAATFFQQAVADMGLSPADVLMVGDDVQADVQGALDAGLQACLVRTGKYRSGDEAQVPAALCVDSLSALVNKLNL